MFVSTGRLIFGGTNTFLYTNTLLVLTLLTLPLCVSKPKMTNYSEMAKEYFSSCYYFYVECLGKDSQRLVDSYSVDFNNYNRFCNEHNLIIFACLNSKLHKKSASIGESLRWCSMELRQSRYSNEHQKRTIRQSQLIIKYLCQYFNQHIFNNPACFLDKLEFCVRLNNANLCHANCDQVESHQQHSSTVSRTRTQSSPTRSSTTIRTSSTSTRTSVATAEDAKIKPEVVSGSTPANFKPLRFGTRTKLLKDQKRMHAHEEALVPTARDTPAAATTKPQYNTAHQIVPSFAIYAAIMILLIHLRRQ